MTRRKLDVRFRELVIRHALQTVTADEMSKLDRYQKLRRRFYGETRHNERQFAITRFALKELAFRVRLHEGQRASPPKHIARIGSVFRKEVPRTRPLTVPASTLFLRKNRARV